MRLRSLCALALTALPAGAGEFLGSHSWSPGWDGSGGYSALWLDTEGTGFVTLSDRGTWVTGTLARDPAGVVAGIEVTGRGPLLRSDGTEMQKGEGDSESIAIVDGIAYVAFEGAHRVMRYPSLDGTPQWIPQLEAFGALTGNRGIEALAADAEGRLYAIPERLPGRRTATFPVWRSEGEIWRQPFALTRDAFYLVTGADIGPDGRLYVLERAFLAIGFRSRLRSMAVDGSEPRLEFESALRAHDNLEGLAVWRDADDRLRATMISDDNQRPWLQRTEFVDYVLD